MFEFKQEEIQGYSISKIRHKESGVYFSFVPAWGGAMFELALEKDNCIYSVLSNKFDGHSFKTSTLPYFAGMKLFPFPNRIKDAHYSYLGKDFYLVNNEPSSTHAIHGLIYNQAFELLELNAETGLIRLEYDYDGNNEAYPFSYQLLIEYQLKKDELIATTKLLNTGSETIIYGDGWHPYFQLGDAIEEIQLKMPGSTFYQLDEVLIPSLVVEKDERFTQLHRLGEQEMNLCLQVEGGEIAETILYSKIKDLTIRVWQEAGEGKYNYVQYFIPPERDSIAVEPMTCIPDAFNNGIGLNYLEPQQEVHFSFGIQII